jgi:hypothetical protein
LCGAILLVATAPTAILSAIFACGGLLETELKYGQQRRERQFVFDDDFVSFSHEAHLTPTRGHPLSIAVLRRQRWLA